MCLMPSSPFSNSGKIWYILLEDNVEPIDWLIACGFHAVFNMYSVITRRPVLLPRRTHTYHWVDLFPCRVSMCILPLSFISLFILIENHYFVNIGIIHDFFILLVTYTLIEPGDLWNCKCIYICKYAQFTIINDLLTYCMPYISIACFTT